LELATFLSLHYSFFLLNSIQGIGVAFLPNVAAYLFGFGADILIFSEKWWLAAGVCIASAGAVVINGVQILPENWPVKQQKFPVEITYHCYRIVI
jgi:hypothetical protein